MGRPNSRSGDYNPAWLLGLLIAFIALCVVYGIGAAQAGEPVRRCTRILESGTKTQAEIADFTRMIRSTRRGVPKIPCKIVYDFKTPSARIHSQSHPVPDEVQLILKRGQKIDVWYDAGTPPESTCEWELLYWQSQQDGKIRGVIALVVITLFIAFLAVWTTAKWWRLRKSGPLPGKQSG